MIKTLRSEYSAKKRKIKKRLGEFKKVWEKGDNQIFAELSFCVCTPQSNAVMCEKAISTLIKSDVLFKGSLREIRKGLKGVRFPNNKAGYIWENRKNFTERGRIRIKDRIDVNNVFQAREWLAKNVKGIGLKEASHFLRNIGLGENLAIIDVHVIKNLARYGLLKDIPKNISRKKYLSLEKILREFSKKINIPMGDLDLLFWSKETGIIFK